MRERRGRRGEMTCISNTCAWGGMMEYYERVGSAEHFLKIEAAAKK